MDEKSKITFADGPTQVSPVGWIAGLPLTVSPGASDILAAVYMAFQLVQQFTGASATMPQQPIVVPQDVPDDEIDPNSLDLQYLNSLSPIARAETLAMYGLQQAGIERREYDEAAATAEQILAGERAKYSPTDEGETE